MESDLVKGVVRFCVVCSSVPKHVLQSRRLLQYEGIRCQKLHTGQSRPTGSRLPTAVDQAGLREPSRLVNFRKGAIQVNWLAAK